MDSAATPFGTPLTGRGRFAALLAALAVVGAVALASGGDALTLLIVPFGLAAIFLIRSPELALLAVVLGIPVDANLVLPVAGGLSLSKLLAVLLLAALSYDVLVRGRRVRLFDDPLDYAVVGLAALVIASCIWGRRAELPSALRLIRMVGFYFCIKNLIGSTDTLRRALWALVLSGTATAIYSIALFVKARIDQGIDLRVGGIALHPNNYAALMLVVVVVAFHLIFQERPRWRWERPAALFACIAGCYAIVLTGSRAGIATLAFAGLLAILRQPMRWRILPAVVVLSALSWLIWPRSVTQRMAATIVENAPRSEVTASAQASLDRRTTYIALALDLIAERPLLGHGYHAFRQLYAESEYVHAANEVRRVERERVAHNTYFELAVGGGMPAALLYASILAIACARLRRVRLGDSGFLGGAAGALEIALIGMAVSLLSKSLPDFKITWFLLGAASAVCAVSRLPLDVPVRQRPALSSR